MRPPTSPIAERHAPAVPASEQRKQRPASQSQIGRALESPASERLTSEPSSAGTNATASSATASATAARIRRLRVLMSSPTSGVRGCCRVPLSLLLGISPLRPERGSPPLLVRQSEYRRSED